MQIIKKDCENTIETLWQTQECNPNGEPFMSIKKSRDYYVYAQRAGRDSIAFVLYDSHIEKFGLIKEGKPPLDTEAYRAFLITAFSGSIDMDLSPQEICQIEVAEEAGYEVPLERITSVGETLVSTQMSQICQLFVVDITGIHKTLTAEWEESETLEQGEVRLIWMSREEVMANMDWKSVFVVGQMAYIEKKQ